MSRVVKNDIRLYWQRGQTASAFSQRNPAKN
jgi:hypothetical protein